MISLDEAYGPAQQPAEPTRGASARMVHEEIERTRVAAVAAPAPPSAVILTPPPSSKPAKVAVAESFDAGTKRDLKKLVLYALVVTLGLALHYVCNDWLTQYLSKAYLSESSEQIAKICYPASIVAVMWIIRTWK